MRAFTVKREYAERIGSGDKRFEIRNFRPTYRGPVVVTISGEKIAYCVAELTDIMPTNNVILLTDEERAYGKCAWLLTNVYRVKPVACRGKLGLWTWTGQPLERLV